MNQDIFVTIEHLRGKVSEISYVMLAAAHDLAKTTGGNVVAVLLGQNARGLASDFNADKVLYAEHQLLAEFTPEAYQKVLSAVIGEQQPRAVLFGHTTIGMDTVGGVSAQLGLPLVSSVRAVTPEGKLISQICGGKIMAECDLPEPTALITLVPGGSKQGQVPDTPITPIPFQLLIVCGLNTQCTTPIR
jgi:electron transfer flavoprotein alpha subunit